MKRKHFISSLVPAAFVLQSSQLLSKDRKDEIEMQAIKPGALKRGDVIGITCPGGSITADEIEPCVTKLKEWGFDVKLGDTVGKKDSTFGGTDDERLSDLQRMLDDKNIKAILCARGGYGVVRIIDKINFKKFAISPKWIIGFSDVTVLHSHINRNYGIATIHSKMCNSFPADWNIAEPMQIDTIESIHKALIGERSHYEFSPAVYNRPGLATGTLIGGNLKTIESLAGSKSDLVTRNKILFVEDTGEYLYSIDRMFWSLKRTEKLDQLKGLIIGGFKIKKDDADAEPFGKSLQDIVLEKVKDFNYPVCFDFPVGHQKNNFALKCGVTHRLSISSTHCSLKEIG
jgi:muramoyltetrapeptide carboxypeptidase